MKQSKLVMPWGSTTVLGAVIRSFQNAGVNEIKVVTGGYSEEVTVEAMRHGAGSVFNPNFANGEMLDSIQAGLSSMQDTAYEAAFVALGDQPGVRSADILEIAKCYFDTRAALIIPSYQMRRGHPWLISRELWADLLDLKHPQTMRDFIEANKEKASYQLIDNPGILQDLDTPEDYEKYKPG
jgi:molybdenum cofactor cytidylyltransferase